MASQSNDPRTVAAEIAREYREAPAKWIQDYICMDAEGVDWMDPDHEGAVCWCLRGAIDKRVPQGAGQVYLAFDRALGYDIASEKEHETLHFVAWNDRPGRTVEEVISLCDAVAHGAALDVTKENNSDR